MCCDTSLLLSYAPIFAGINCIFPLFITVSRYYDMYTQGGVTCIRRAVLHVYAGRCYIYALRTPKGVLSCLPVLNAHEPCSWLNGTAPVRNLIFGLIVHAYSCYQSENIYFICLLKRVIDPSVLNHSV